MTDWNLRGSMELLTMLRKRLLITVAAVVIGMGISWNFSAALLNFVEKPLKGRTYLSDLKEGLSQGVKDRYPALYDQLELGKDPVSSAKERRLNYATPLEPFFIQ